VLLCFFQSVTSDNNSESEIVALLLQFIDMSSIFLARLARTKGSDKIVKHLPSVVVFLDIVRQHTITQSKIKTKTNRHLQ
jgi:hypothetical protein